MERVIKFRVWFTFGDNGVLAYVKSMRLEKDGWHVQGERDGRIVGGVIREELQLMQYTGREDKNNVKAYEGDIYTCGYQYSDGTHKYGDRNIIEDIRTFNPEDEFEIIGNIFENPELIKAA